MSLDELAAEWKRASDKSMADALAKGLPPNVVTEERMRWLVFQWVAEIDAVKHGLRG